MNTLLIATHNPAKLNDLSRFLSDIPYDLISLDDVGISEDIEETGKTFEQNAVLKAKHYAKKSGLPTIADDAGIEIDYLSGAPGVYSKRWAGDTSDEAIISHTLKQLDGVPIEKRGAQFHVVIAFAVPKIKQTDKSQTLSGITVYTAEAVTRGIIAEKAYDKSQTKKFPYNQLLYLSDIKKYFHDDELTEAEQFTYNHRRIALDKLKKNILLAL